MLLHRNSVTKTHTNIISDLMKGRSYVILLVYACVWRGCQSFFDTMGWNKRGDLKFDKIDFQFFVPRHALS